MRVHFSHLASIGLVFASWGIGWSGCTTAQVDALPPLPPTPPDYVQVPHPDGLNTADLMAIFTERTAPSPETLKSCDTDYFKLRQVTESQDEILRGAREMVRWDPVKYHWCFYGKILALDEQVKQDVYVDEKQKHVLDAYIFLTPVARAFLLEFNDSRYLRWASHRYRQMSEVVFFRKLDFSMEVSEQLVTATSPLGLVRQTNQEPGGVLEKYNLVKPDEAVKPADIPPTAELSERQPASDGTATEAVMTNGTIKPTETSPAPSK